MADPVKTNTATAESTSASVVATFGFTATAGRLLVLHVVSDDYMASPPSGWTRPTGAAQESYLGHYVCYKIAAGSETSVTYVIGSATNSRWVIEEYDSIYSFDISNGQASAGSATNYSTPAVVATAGRRFAIASIGCSSQFRDITGMAGWTNGFTEQADQRTTNGTGTQDAVGTATLAFDGNGSTSLSTTATFSQSGANEPDRATGILLIFKVTDSGSINVNATGISSTVSRGPVSVTGVIARVDYIGSITPVESNNANLTLTEPAGTKQGDLLVVAIAHRGTIGFQKPADWTSKLLDQSSGNTSTTVASSIASGELFYTVRGASAPTLTFTKESGTGDVNRGVMVALRGQDATTPIRASLQTTLAANSNTVVTDGTISPQIGDLVLAAFCGADNVTWSSEQINGAPTALIEIADAGSNTGADNSIGVAYLTLTAANISSQTVQATASGTNSRHVVLVIDVAPQSTSAPVTVTLGPGPAATASVGAPSVAVYQPFSVSGIASTASTGSVSLTGLANIAATGLSTTATQGLPNTTGAAQVSVSVAGSVLDPTFVNAIGNVLASSGSTGASPTLSTTTGNFLFGHVSHYTTGINVSSATDSAGNQWSRAGTQQGGDADHDNEIWYTQNPIVGNAANALTFSFSGTASFRIVSQAQFNWPGAQSIAFDTEAAHNLSDADPITSASFATSFAEDLILGGFVAWDGTSELGNSSGTIAWEDGPAAVDNAAFAYRMTDAPGTYAISLTRSNANRFSVVAKAFRAVAASTGLQSTVGFLTVTISSGVVTNPVGLSATVTLGSTTQTAFAAVTPAGQLATMARGSLGISVGDIAWSTYPGATSYRLYWGTTSSLYTQNINVGNVLSYPLSSLGLAANTTYYIQVRAFDGVEHDHEAEKVVLNSVIATNPYLVLLVSGLETVSSFKVPGITALANTTLSSAPAAAVTAGAVMVTAVGSVSVNLTGIGAAAALGNVIAAMVVNVPVSGLAVTSTAGVTIVTAPISVSVSGFALHVVKGSPGVFGGHLTWGESVSAIGYRIYWGTTSGVYTQSVDVGNVLSYSLALLNLQRETTYYSVVRAWNGALESTNSGEIILFNGGMLIEPYTLASLSGRSVTTTRGTPSVVIAVSATPVGRSVSVTIGVVSVTTTNNILVNVSGREVLSTVGAPVVQVAATSVVAGLEAVAVSGPVVVIADIVQNASVPAVGVLATATLGSASITGAVSPLAAGLPATTGFGLPIAAIAISVPTSGALTTALRGVLTVTGTASIAPVGRQAASIAGAPTPTAAAAASMLGLGSTITLNSLDIDVDVTVDYPVLGIGLASALGNLTVAIQGAISFSVAGIELSSVLSVPQCVGTATVPATKYLITSSLNSPAVAITPSVAAGGLLASATVGNVGVLTNAGAALANPTVASLAATLAAPSVSISSLLELPPGFYITGAFNGNLDYRYGIDIDLASLEAYVDHGPLSLANDVEIFASGLGVAAGAGKVDVSQNVGGNVNGVSLAARLGNPRVRTRNPHATWMHVVVSGARSFFRPGRMW